MRGCRFVCPTPLPGRCCLTHFIPPSLLVPFCRSFYRLRRNLLMLSNSCNRLSNRPSSLVASVGINALASSTSVMHKLASWAISNCVNCSPVSGASISLPSSSTVFSSNLACLSSSLSWAESVMEQHHQQEMFKGVECLWKPEEEDANTQLSNLTNGVWILVS